MNQAEVNYGQQARDQFFDLDGRPDVLAMVNRLKGDIHLTANVTKHASMLTGYTVPANLLAYCEGNATRAEKSSRVASWVTGVLKLSTDGKTHLWMLSRKYITACIREISKPEYNALRLKINSSRTKNEATSDELDDYAADVARFNNGLEEAGVMIFDELRNHAGRVGGELPVDHRTAAGLNRILGSMITKRNARLEEAMIGGMDLPARERFYAARGAAVNRRERNEFFDDSHIVYYQDYILDVNASAMKPLGMRTNVGEGLLDENFPAWRTRNGTDKRGQLLLTSAMRAIIQRDGMLVQHWHGDTRPAIVKALAEIEAGAGNAAQERAARNTLAQQCANICVKTNFWATLSALNLIGMTGTEVSMASWVNLKKVNQGLYALCNRIEGREHLMAMMQAAGGAFTMLHGLMHVSPNMYMPPWAITPARVTNVFGLNMGIYLASRIELSFFNPGICERQFIAFGSLSRVAMSYIITFFDAIEAINRDAESNINESEHIFHQILMNKLSGICCNIGMRGNVFGITLVNRMFGGDNEILPQQEMIHRLALRSGIDAVAAAVPGGRNDNI